MKKALRYLLIVGLMALLVAPALAQADQSIAFGQTIEGEIEDNETESYTFQGEAGQLVSITLISDDFDPLLVLLDADGQELTINDDGGPGSLNARIGPYPLPEDGEYTIVVDSYSHYYSTFSASLEGEYTLTLEQVDFQPIEYTQKVEGELGDNSQAYYRFHGEAGDVINIVATSDDFGTRVSLSSDGNLLMSDDAWSSDDGTALIGGYTLPSSGSFVVVVESSSGEGGEFSLLVEQVEVQPLSLGDTVSIKFNQDNLVSYFRFEGKAGDVISLIVEGGRNFDTTLALNSPDGYQLAYNDDYNNLDPALVNQILPIDGAYTVVVQPYQPGAEGAVTLTLERGVLTSLDDGPVTLEMSSNHTHETLVFTGIAGEDARLIIEVLDGQQASPNIGIMQGEQSLAYASATTVTRLSFDFTVPSGGDVFVQIDEYSYTDLTLRVTLEHEGAAATPAATAEATAEPTKETTKSPEPTEEPEVTATPTGGEATAEPTEQAGNGGAPEETVTPEPPAATDAPEATAAA